MKRTFTTITLLAVFAAATAAAGELEKQDDTTVQLKPPPEQRIDGRTPDLHDSLTVAPQADDRAIAPAQLAASQDASSLHGVWRPEPGQPFEP